MKIYALKFVAALLNFLLVSFVVRALPEALTRDYLLVLGYIVLGALVVGFGVDTGAERYLRRLLIHWSKLRLLAYILIASVLRVAVLAGVVLLVNRLFPGLVSFTPQSHALAYGLAFATFLFITLSAVLNGALQYMDSALSHLIRAALRATILLLPLGAISLQVLLTLELIAVGCAALFCLWVFLRKEVELSSKPPEPRVVVRFLGWNYLSRLFLNLVSLNTVKILILRSNHPNAVLYAYAIQLTESVERFLPSLVLAGRYMPDLSKTFDEHAFGPLKRRLVTLARQSLLCAGLMVLMHLAVVPLAFVLLQGQDPAPFWPLILTCAAWLFVVNIRYNLDIVTNVIEANDIQCLASLTLTLIAAALFTLTPPENPLTTLLTLTLTMTTYPVIWTLFAYSRLRGMG